MDVIYWLMNKFTSRMLLVVSKKRNRKTLLNFNWSLQVNSSWKRKWVVFLERAQRKWRVERPTERDCEATSLYGAEQLHKEVSVLNTQHILFCKHLSGLHGCLCIPHFFFLPQMTSNCRVCLRILGLSPSDFGLLSGHSILELCNTFGLIWFSSNDKLECLGMCLVTIVQEWWLLMQ